jgi:hypothetical protein
LRAKVIAWIKECLIESRCDDALFVGTSFVSSTHG